MIRDHVDFNNIEPRYREIHGRLENWARSLYSPSSSKVLAMFCLYRSDDHWEGPQVSMPVDTHDAHKIAKGVIALPQEHRVAIQWFYVRPGNPRRVCQLIGTNMSGLDRLVRDGRVMLVNRGI